MGRREVRGDGREMNEKGEERERPREEIKNRKEERERQTGKG
jgi:hypothetical protein